MRHNRVRKFKSNVTESYDFSKKALAVDLLKKAKTQDLAARKNLRKRDFSRTVFLKSRFTAKKKKKK